MLDTKMDITRSLGSTPVPAKLCGQTKAVAQWALWTWTFQIQKVWHIPSPSPCFYESVELIPLIDVLNLQVSEAIQRLLIRLLPVMLYASLLVSVVQAGAVFYLLALSFLPLGAWFLLACIGIMCYFYVSTAMRSMCPASTPRQLVHSPSSSSLTPSSSEHKLHWLQNGRQVRFQSAQVTVRFKTEIVQDWQTEL